MLAMDLQSTVPSHLKLAPRSDASSPMTPTDPLTFPDAANQSYTPASKPSPDPFRKVSFPHPRTPSDTVGLAVHKP